MKWGKRKVRISTRVSVSVSEIFRTYIQNKDLRHSAVSHEEPPGQPLFKVQLPEY